MSIRTVENFVDALSSEISWRRKELTELRYALEAPTASSTRRAALTRAALALLYAHWEGYVKGACEKYLEFVCMQRRKNSELSDSLLAVTMRASLQAAVNAGKIGNHVEVVRFFRTQMEARSRMPFKNVIRTESNLSSTVFLEIVRTLGLPISDYESKAHLLDHQLLARRNHIAHGNALNVDVDEYLGLHDEVLGLMNTLRNRLENAAVNGECLRV
jgi:hypothetical protein